MAMKLRDMKPWRPVLCDRALGWAAYHGRGPASVVAALYRRAWGRRTSIVAITGSFGKTTTTRAVLAAFELPEHRYHADSFNALAMLYLLSIRLTGRRLWAVLEFGVARPGQMRCYTRALRPKIGVVTGVGEAHLENYPDGLEGLRREKSVLVCDLPPDGAAVLNYDDPHARAMASQTCARVVTYGFNPRADVAAVAVRLRWPEGTDYDVRLPQRTVTVCSRLIGRANGYAVLAALAAAHAAGLDLDRAVAALERFTPTPERAEIVRLAGGAVVIVDTTKCSTPTLRLAVDMLAEVPAARRLAVLGHVPRKAPEPKEPVYEAMGRYAGRVLDRAYLVHRVDSQFDAYRAGLITGGMDPAHIVRVRSVHDAAEQLRRELRAGDVLLLKAHVQDRLARIALLLHGLDVRCRAAVCPRSRMVPCARCCMLYRDFNPPLPDHERERMLMNRPAS